MFVSLFTVTYWHILAYKIIGIWHQNIYMYPKVKTKKTDIIR